MLLLQQQYMDGMPVMCTGVCKEHCTWQTHLKLDQRLVHSLPPLSDVLGLGVILIIQGSLKLAVELLRGNFIFSTHVTVAYHR